MRQTSLLAVTMLAALACSAQSTSPQMNPRDRQEYPLILHGTVVAGQTSPGAKIQAKLLIATMVHGTVIPEGAVFTGAVEESSAKSSGSPSRLKIHLTAAKWKDHTVAVDLYLTNYYYPRPGQYLTATERADADWAETLRRVHGQRYRAPGETAYPPKVLMKEIKLERGADGTVTITSAKSNPHLFSDVIYCFEGSVVEAEKPTSK